MTTAKPFLMFQGGCAQAALDLYFSTFPDSRMVRVERYAEGDPGPVGTIKVAVFTICGREFMCSDSPIKHGFSFTPSSSTFVEFDSLAEQQRVFDVLAEGGQVKAVVASGCADYTRKQLDELTELVKKSSAKGLAWLARGAGRPTSTASVPLRIARSPPSATSTPSARHRRPPTTVSNTASPTTRRCSTAVW